MEQIQKDELFGISIDNLPPEMLQMVLKNLDAPSLFACRSVCRKWNDMSNYILHDRPETELLFDFSFNTVHFLKGQGKECEGLEVDGKCIQDFVECVTQSGDFRCSPFARFSLIDIQKWDEFISNFLSVVSQTATCLKLRFARGVIKDTGLVEKLRNLLLYETPCLKEFGLGFEEDKRRVGVLFSDARHNPSASPSVRASKLGLFPSPKEISREDNSTLKKDPAAIKLPKLKVLQLGYGFEDESTAEIVRDILRIAPNLEKIQYLVCYPNRDDESPFCNHDDFLFFLDFGKINTLKHVSFVPSTDFLADWKNTLEKRKINPKEISSFFKIQELQLWFDKLPQVNIKNVKNQWVMEALQLVEQIFEGSKNTLEKLHVAHTFEFPRSSPLPTFTKLSIVEFSHWTFGSEENLVVTDSMFPAGCRLLNIFPNVKMLDLGNFSSNLKHFFPREDSIPVMPSVHTLSFEAVDTNGEDIEIMALLCPNLKKLKHVNMYGIADRVYYGKAALEDFPSFGSAVFKNMKNLESLQLIIDADAEANSFPALDSTFTGISKENCLRLFEALNMDENSHEKLRREAELKGLRVNESILDLPKLKELNIKIHNEYRFPQSDPDAAYKSCVEEALSHLSHVSELYAFRLMPALKYDVSGEAYHDN